MIRVFRPAEIPPSLQPDKIKNQLAKLKKFYKPSADKRTQDRFEFDYKPLKSAETYLAKVFNNKCAYCEAPIKSIRSADLENFRPKRGAKGFSGEEFSDDHYWWLFYEWRNLYYSCEQCNRFKQTFFPVAEKRIAVGTAYEDIINNEKNLLIDPCNEYPELFLQFNGDGTVEAASESNGKTISEKGRVTIDVLKLNRTDLIQNRKKALSELVFKCNEIKKTFYSKKISESTVVKRTEDFLLTVTKVCSENSAEEYLGANRSYLKNWMDSASFEFWFLEDDRYIVGGNELVYKVMSKYKVKFKRHINNIQKPYKEADKKETEQTNKVLSGETGVFLKRIEIRNFKSLKRFSLNFPSKQVLEAESPNITLKYIDNSEPWLMLLGENGVGKSSLLQAIALTLMGQKYIDKLKRVKLDFRQFVCHDATSGYVKIFVHGTEKPYSIKFSKTGELNSTIIGKPPTSLLAYGSTRLLPIGRLKPEIADGRVKALNLFRPDVALTDAKAWLIGLYKESTMRKKKKPLFGWIGRAIKDLLLFTKKEELTVIENEVCIRYSPKKYDRLDDLSDGYKSVIALAIDIIKTLIKDNTTIEAVQGIVLIDEIGTHLHPTWRMQVVKRFRQVFPRVQFIVTTHDPLCLRGLKKGEVAVFIKDKRHRIHVATELPDPGGFNAEQLLSSEFFGLNSTKEPEVADAFNEYYYLLSRKDLSAKQESRLTKLKNYLRDKQHLGNSMREEMMLVATDKLLAETKTKNIPIQRFKLEAETIEEVKNVYQTIETTTV